MEYRRYYFLEDYLLGEVNQNFHRNHFLMVEEFFCIVIWKSNRAKTAIKRRLLKIHNNLQETVKELTNDIYKATTNDERLGILLGKWRFQLPMASAILTVLYPEEFSIYDERVRKQLGMNAFSSKKKYFTEFLPKLKAVDAYKNLRDKDRYLWGKSFFEDLQHFLKPTN